MLEDLEQTNWVQCEIQIRDERMDQLGWRAEHPERTVRPDQRLRCGQDRVLEIDHHICETLHIL